MTNEWQELTYSYTATETTAIEVGLRFYDIGDFDGEEIVYVDNLVFEVDDGETGDSENGDSENGDSENGNSETGDSETGNSETGDSETGDSETGDSETGDSETGDSETVLNDSFEEWTDGVPSGWTTIDTGITVTQSTDIYYSDTSSAEISVNTASQGDTDVRQYVDVKSRLNVLIYCLGISY